MLTSLFKARFLVTTPAPTLLARRVSASCARETERERDRTRENEVLALRPGAAGKAGDGYRPSLEAPDDDLTRFRGTLRLGSGLSSISIGELDRECEAGDTSSEKGELGNILVRNRAHSSGSFGLNLCGIDRSMFARVRLGMSMTYCVSTISSQKTCIQSRSSLTGPFEVRKVEWSGTSLSRDPRSCHVDNLSMNDSRRSSVVGTET